MIQVSTFINALRIVLRSKMLNGSGKLHINIVGIADRRFEIAHPHWRAWLNPVNIIEFTNSSNDISNFAGFFLIFQKQINC